MTTIDVKGICMSGGSVVVNTKDFSPLDLKSIALTAKLHGVHVTIKGASALSPLSCKGIALSGDKGTVIFDLTE